MGSDYRSGRPWPSISGMEGFQTSFIGKVAGRQSSRRLVFEIVFLAGVPDHGSVSWRSLALPIDQHFLLQLLKVLMD